MDKEIPSKHTKKSEVVILIFEMVTLKIKSTKQNKEGQNGIAKGKINEENITIINVYLSDNMEAKDIRQALLDYRIIN